MNHISETPHLVNGLAKRLESETGFKLDCVASNVRRYPRGGPFVRVLDPQGAELFHTDNFVELTMFAQGIIAGWRVGATASLGGTEKMKESEVVVGAVLIDGMNTDIRYRIISVGLSAACVVAQQSFPHPEGKNLRRMEQYGPVMYDIDFLCKNFQSVKPVCQPPADQAESEPT